MIKEIELQLEDKIIPFWRGLNDRTYGGFYGHVDYQLNIDKQAEKSLISTARHLFSFSLWFNHFKNEAYLKEAKHAFEFLLKYKDHKYDGYVWMVDYQGQHTDLTKHIYGQSFAIYGLSEYYRATKDSKALDEALALFKLIEEKSCKNLYIYHEAFAQRWEKSSNELLSVHDTNLVHTMNTVIHILEAYTNLYKVSKDNDVKQKIIEILEGIYYKFYDNKQNRFFMYLDYGGNVVDMGESFGHDIETCWLVDEALQSIEVELPHLRQMTYDVCEHVFKEGFTDMGLISERINGIDNEERVWWIQSEAMVGFYNHYQKTKNKTYLEAVKSIYEFVIKFIADERDNAEWLWGVDKDFKPMKHRGFAESWKTGYHNGRALIELIRRGDSHDSSKL